MRLLPFVNADADVTWENALIWIGAFSASRTHQYRIGLSE